MPVANTMATGVRRLVYVESPSWPWILLPHAHNVPSRLMASAKSWPAATATICVNVVTRTGNSRVSVEPSPSCPLPFAPHAQIAPPSTPSSSSATVNCRPAAMRETPLNDGMSTGAYRVMVVPSPSWPLSLAPQVQMVPSLLSATECLYPAATATTPVSPETEVGTSLAVVVPSPSSPDAFVPHAQAAPSALTATACVYP